MKIHDTEIFSVILELFNQIAIQTSNVLLHYISYKFLHYICTFDK